LKARGGWTIENLAFARVGDDKVIGTAQLRDDEGTYGGGILWSSPSGAARSWTCRAAPPESKPSSSPADADLRVLRRLDL